MSDYSPAAAEVKQLRDATGAGMMDCKKALIEVGGTSIGPWSTCVRRASRRLPNEPVVPPTRGSSMRTHQQHRRGARRGQLRDRLRGQDRDFQRLAKDIALHIASPSAPRFLTRDEVPQGEIDRERHFAEVQAKGRRQPSVIEKIVEEDQRLPQGHRAARPAVREGRLEDGAQLLDETSAKVGERIAVRRFARFKLGEAGDDEATDGGES